MHRKFLFIKENKLLCSVHVPTNMKVFVMQGQILCYPTKTSVHIGNDVHILDEYGTYLTHSFKPNCRIDGFNVIAIKNIIPGDVLTYDFNKTEINMVEPFIHDGILVGGIKHTNLHQIY